MDQIMLFGDSITEFAEGPDGFSAVMRHGTPFHCDLKRFAAARSNSATSYLSSIAGQSSYISRSYRKSLIN
jgi:hypothetical protein